MVQKEALELFPDAQEKIAVIPARYQGLTKREYFAAMAMQGLLASDNAGDPAWLEKEVALLSVSQADALIAALNKEPKP